MDTKKAKLKHYPQLNIGFNEAINQILKNIEKI